MAPLPKGTRHPITIPPVRPFYRFSATFLGASMWFFVSDAVLSLSLSPPALPYTSSCKHNHYIDQRHIHPPSFFLFYHPPFFANAIAALRVGSYAVLSAS